MAEMPRRNGGFAPCCRVPALVSSRPWNIYPWRTVMTLRKSIVIATVAAIVAAAPAFAGEQGGVAVRYDDLNLARHAGAEVLVGRLWQAAKQVCGKHR